MRDAVALAIEALSWMEFEGLSERAAFARASKQLQVTETSELKTAQLQIMETLRRRNFIDYIVENAAGSPPDIDSLQHGVRSFLRLFCYWARFHGADEDQLVRIIQAARSVLGWKTLHPIEPLFGGILALDLTEATNKLTSDEILALKLFHPTWFVSACRLLLGRSTALKLMRRNLDRAPSYIRVNTLRGSEEACLREVERARIKVEPVEGLPFTLKVLSSKRPIVQTDAYRHGIIVLQDKASILASLVAAPRPGNSVFDVCAAPGAKTTHLAQLMENKGTIYSIDKSGARMSLWKREIDRLGVKIAHPLLADASMTLPAKVDADVVILDPPCSNTGTFWKSPNAKWVMTPERVRQLAATQRVMLQNASRLVRENGTLVYGTCSILAEENECVVSRFLRVNPDFKAVDSSPRIGLPGSQGLDLSQRLFPHIHDCNGHFLSKMMRVG